MNRHREAAVEPDRRGFKLLLYELSIAMVPWLATCACAPAEAHAVTPTRQLGAGLLMATLTIELLGHARASTPGLAPWLCADVVQNWPAKRIIAGYMLSIYLSNGMCSLASCRSHFVIRSHGSAARVSQVLCCAPQPAHPSTWQTHGSAQDLC